MSQCPTALCVCPRLAASGPPFYFHPWCSAWHVVSTYEKSLDTYAGAYTKGSERRRSVKSARVEWEGEQVYQIDRGWVVGKVSWQKEVQPEGSEG